MRTTKAKLCKAFVSTFPTVFICDCLIVLTATRNMPCVAIATPDTNKPFDTSETLFQVCETDSAVYTYDNPKDVSAEKFCDAFLIANDYSTSSVTRSDRELTSDMLGPRFLNRLARELDAPAPRRAKKAKR